MHSNFDLNGRSDGHFAYKFACISVGISSVKYLSERKMFRTDVVDENEIHILCTMYAFLSLRFSKYLKSTDAMRTFPKFHIRHSNSGLSNTVNLTVARYAPPQLN